MAWSCGCLLDVAGLFGPGNLKHLLGMSVDGSGGVDRGHIFLCLQALDALLLHAEVPNPASRLVSVSQIWPASIHGRGVINDMRRWNERKSTYQVLSSPFSKNEQSPLTTHSHCPPPTPPPFRHPTSGTSSAFSFRQASISFASLLPPFLTNFVKEQVPHLKSSSPSSSGIRPVSTLPMAIIAAACVQIRRLLGRLRSASALAIR